MPVKRRTAKMKRDRITPDALAAFKAGRWMDLHRALGLRPWEASPLDVTTPAPGYHVTDSFAASWDRARALRGEMEGAQ